jgi:hypothetical protein
MVSLLDDATIIGLSRNYVSAEMMSNTDCGGSAEFYRGYVSAMVCVLNSARSAGNAASYLRIVEGLDDSIAVPPHPDDLVSGAKFALMNAHSYGRYARDNPGTPLGDVFTTLNEDLASKARCFAGKR